MGADDGLERARSFLTNEFKAFLEVGWTAGDSAVCQSVLVKLLTSRDSLHIAIHSPAAIIPCSSMLCVCPGGGNGKRETGGPHDIQHVFAPQNSEPRMKTSFPQRTVYRNLRPGKGRSGMGEFRGASHAEDVTDVHGLQHLQAGGVVVASHVQEAWNDLSRPCAGLPCCLAGGEQHMTTYPALFSTLVLYLGRNHHLHDGLATGVCAGKIRNMLSKF
jgi:hypothetical protein